MTKSKNKNKKRKLNHSNQHLHNGKPSNGDDDLTHEEMWDDSALIRSWNEAVAEYDFYHSIHARGEDVDEVLRKYHAANGGSENDQAEEGELADEEEAESEEGEIAEGSEANDNEANGEDDKGANEVSDHSALPTIGEDNGDQPIFVESLRTPPMSSEPPPTTGVTDPHGRALNGQQSHPTDQIQTLENIKMAYYWAGYYSGLYDGQKQAQAQTQTQAHAGTDTPTKPAPT